MPAGEAPHHSGHPRSRPGWPDTAPLGAYRAANDHLMSIGSRISEFSEPRVKLPHSPPEHVRRSATFKLEHIGLQPSLAPHRSTAPSDLHCMNIQPRLDSRHLAAGVPALAARLPPYCAHPSAVKSETADTAPRQTIQPTGLRPTPSYIRLRIPRTRRAAAYESGPCSVSPFIL